MSAQFQEPPRSKTLISSLALSVKLTIEDMAELEAMGRPDSVKGKRSDPNIVT